ncbi:MAG: hypothetical protein NVS1B14_04280 [Vulcanimicrobiaceae bacterium]
MDGFINTFFAYAPWIVFLAVILAVYFASRQGLRRAPAPIGQTFACNQCGHRGKREHMFPIARAGSVLWYCPRHADEPRL